MYDISILSCYLSYRHCSFQYNFILQVHILDSKNTLVFVVDDFKTAKTLQNINGRIKLHHQKVRCDCFNYLERVKLF